MFYNQIDKEWNKEIMTFHKDQNNPDYIQDWGCLLVAFANILKHKGFFITPKNLNEIIKQYKGYLYLYDNSTPKEKASFLRTEIIEKLYDCNIIKIEKNNFYYDINTYYIALIKSKLPINNQILNVFHFINVLKDNNKTKTCYDVYNGKIKIIKNEEILNYKKIKFNN